MRNKGQKQSISGLAALLLFGVFALGILSVLLTGANAYRRLTERDRLRYDSRTCVRYVAAKLHQAVSPDAVTVVSFGEGDALLLHEEIAGEAYCTRIYCNDGWLMELYTSAAGEFSPEDGEKILPAESLALTLEGGLLRAEIVDGNGQPLSLRLQLRGGEGAAA